MSYTSSIQVKCPLCTTEIPIQSPEELCGHMAQCHNIHTTMQSKCFESFAHFQIWLSHIEDSRCDGGYLGSSQGPSYEDEYYLLCRRRPTATSKRRRMSDDVRETNSIVACTAFVHVFETMDGRVTTQQAFGTRSTLKRSSPCATYELCDEICDCDESSSSMASSPSSSVDFDDEDASNNNYKMTDSMDAYTVSSMSVIINQRLDSTADRLKSITKVLQELAVDIRNSDLHRQMVI
ncbi:hypothetical protein L5515_004887 [Caenorhabditis briggsae]|uniref:Uncharacterized protein n=1 Tax=Caenorhabditis briggsae TaxID=6238 RepID=A0AAE9EIV5_CAEBR|nr:hypothetical protein L5515_004887 [Caenorhabditis briggsae]